MSVARYNPKARHRARFLAIQALYQWQISQSNLIDIEQQFLINNDMKHIDQAYFIELLHGVPNCLNELEKLFMPLSDRSIEEITPIELTVLRIASFELLKRTDIPYKVIINEALELTKTFGTSDGFKFVNGILDKLSQQLRSIEIKAS